MSGSSSTALCARNVHITLYDVTTWSRVNLVNPVLPQLSSLAVRIMMRSVIRTPTDDSCVRGGLHGYKATGHAREKPNLPICAYEIGDLEIIILV